LLDPILTALIPSPLNCCWQLWIGEVFTALGLLHLVCLEISWTCSMAIRQNYYFNGNLGVYSPYKKT